MWQSGIFKHPVNGRVFAGFTNLEGNGQADLKNHGGRDKAIHMYPLEHYAYWRDVAGFVQMRDGIYGENLTTLGLNEHTTCLGDIYSIGGCVLQVSQPRVPCWKPARKVGVPGLAAIVLATGRTGWYMRVLTEGQLGAGDDISLLERPRPQWTIQACNEVMHHQRANVEAASMLAAVPELAQSWASTLRQRLSSPIHGGFGDN